MSTVSWMIVPALLTFAATNCIADDAPKSEPGKIYRCESQGHVTYSDTACAQAPDKTEVNTEGLNGYRSESIDNPPLNSSNGSSPSRADNKSAKDHSRSIAEEQAERRERCRQIASASETIRGYETHRDTVRQFASDADSQIAQKRKGVEKARAADKCR